MRHGKALLEAHLKELTHICFVLKSDLCPYRSGCACLAELNVPMHARKAIVSLTVLITETINAGKAFLRLYFFIVRPAPMLFAIRSFHAIQPGPTTFEIHC